MTGKIELEIVCPRCTKKAIFHSVLIGTYKMYPDKNGNVTCTHCGFNANHIFSNADYYYRVSVVDRTLYAQTLDKLILLQNYFKNYDQNKIHHDPNIDFPKTFYKNRKEIVKRIDSILEKEIGNAAN